MSYHAKIGAGEFVAGAIVNADISASAAIALSKLATDPLARANHTGTQLHTTISDFDSGVQTNRLDQMAAPTASVGMGSQNFSSLAAATVAGEAVEFSQFEAALDGLSYKEPVQLISTSNITLSGEQTIDGILTSSSRVLVNGQTDATENGIYVSDAGAWSRADDANTAAELNDGATVWVKQGSASNANKRYTQTLTVATLGSDNVNFVLTGEQVVSAVISDNTDVDTTGAGDGALFRFDTSDNKWADTTTLLYSDAGQLQASTTGSSAGLLLGGDAQLYRSNADELRTPDALIVDGVLTSAGRRIGVRTESADYNVDLSTDDMVIMDSSGAVRNATLPASHSAGALVTIKREGANTVNILTADADTIDGAASHAISVDYRSITVVSDGTNWHIR